MTKDQFNTPILLIAFNRPETTKIVFEEIRKVRPKNFFMAVDGPRNGNEKDKTKVEKVREIIKKVDWPCKVKTLFRKENLGCKFGESSAITWFFKNVENGIILEDDNFPDPSFFKFCEELLEKYKNDERVMHISGNNFQRGRSIDNYSYYFSRYAHIWGWASWRRAWEKYDITLKSYPELRKKGYFKMLHPDFFERKNTLKNLDACYYKNFNTWDYQWTFSLLVNNGLAIIPNKNLVKNIGFIENSTHTKPIDSFLSMPAGKMEFPLKHPQFIIHNSFADRRYFRWTFIKKIRNFFLKKTGLINLFKFEE